jgi:adenylosuccinate synthase
LLDAASEAARGENKIGSTLRGIGPTYRDKTGRSGIRIGDIFLKDFDRKYQETHLRSMALVQHYGYTDFDLKQLEEEFFMAVDYLREFKFVESEYFINDLISQGKRVLAEGAQGSMLDIDFGCYPYVTSSNTISGGVCTGLGIAPKQINKVKGIFKAYCTRVGGGPFPTELNDETGELLRKIGNEYGATTGRPRRTGWIDLVALKYAIMLNGVDELIMMKSDVLSGFEEVLAATAYKVDGVKTTQIPFEVCEARIEPVYESQKGWSEDLTGIRDFKGLPQTFKDYIDFVNRNLDSEISLLSVGPDRGSGRNEDPEGEKAEFIKLVSLAKDLKR